MCIGDWRLGRLIRTVHTSQALAAGNGLTLNQNAQRVGLTIGISGVVIGSLANVNIQVDGVVLWSMKTGESYLHVTLATHGELPGHTWIITPVTSSQTINVIEYFMPEEYLCAGLDEFRRMMSELYASK